MGLLQVINDAPGYLKATFQGPQGSGKTRTAIELACEAKAHFGSEKPIAFYDTETGSDYTAKLIREMSGMDPIRVKTRAFRDLREVVNECVAGASDVLIVDSITHVWRELQEAYMAKANEKRRYPKNRMDIQDIMQVKKLWEPWPDEFLSTPIHIIVCGREGNEWGSEENEETGKRDLVQTGKKMKVEAEFGYEASLMVAMNRVQQAEGMVKHRDGTRERKNRAIINVATVLKDRFDVINGSVFEFPTGKDFMPHLALLKPAAHRPMDNAVKSQGEMPDVTDDGWGREKKQRVIICEEIQGEMTRVYPGLSAKEKACKSALLEKAFGTRSWTKVEATDSNKLYTGLSMLRDTLADPAAFESEMAANGHLSAAS